MSTYRAAINGFGRIGRTLLKEALRRNELDIVAVHDLADMPTLLHLLKYDSTQGIFEMSIESVDENKEFVDEVQVPVVVEPPINPTNFTTLFPQITWSSPALIVGN